jgi:hypothetical protein
MLRCSQLMFLLQSTYISWLVLNLYFRHSFGSRILVTGLWTLIAWYRRTSAPDAISVFNCGFRLDPILTMVTPLVALLVLELDESCSRPSGPQPPHGPAGPSSLTAQQAPAPSQPSGPQPPHSPLWSVVLDDCIVEVPLCPDVRLSSMNSSLNCCRPEWEYSHDGNCDSGRKTS